ncbi:iron-containing alcohol dehydrogenase [Dysgonomonas sp. Marseille-P4677]|uniref:iron-containing alcohol dehydrogenase n=1 Tax=Dysgonomonas sp. Marseille-P4677 TaxID=2364790 RepID=UPI0019139AAA|nr:iron-containing alcohol dehydrogenase [Dysgonomonas sp. Marseille-P4677]MBK5722497.1 iron-containing alcohol dehydrogenase [Dysgonomonas sp. Marseille-P4677]
MENFTYVNPVKIIFGKDTIKEIVKEIPKASKILMIYGGGSIKKNGVYDQTVEALGGYEWSEFSGIEPNPHYETCMKAVAVIKEKNIDFLLSVGGGSVLDATKFIAAAACFEDGDPWAILSKRAVIKKALSFGDIITLPATGSEMNSGGVITRAETQEKLAFGSSLTFPKFSVLDPTVTYTLPVRQVGNGVVDAFVHVMEQYLTYNEDDTLLQDHLSEAIVKTLVAEGPKALSTPTDYNVRANLMWASTWALNGWIAQGAPEDWATHMIGHEITAFYGLDHAQTLAIVLPGVMTVLKEQKGKKIIRLGKEVFGIEGNGAIEKTIEAVEGFFETMGVKTHLSDYGLGDEAIEKVSKRLADRGWKLGECGNITSDVVKEILILRK